MREIPCSLKPNTCPYCHRCHSQRMCPDHILTLTFADSALPKKKHQPVTKNWVKIACVHDGKTLECFDFPEGSLWICLWDNFASLFNSLTLFFTLSNKLTCWPPPPPVCPVGWIWPLAFVTLLPTCGRPLTCALPFSLGRTGELDDILPEFDMEIMPGMAASFLSSSLQQLLLLWRRLLGASPFRLHWLSLP